MIQEVNVFLCYENVLGLKCTINWKNTDFVLFLNVRYSVFKVTIRVWLLTSTILLFVWSQFSFHIPLLILGIILSFSQGRHLATAHERVKMSGRSVFVYKK